MLIKCNLNEKIKLKKYYNKNTLYRAKHRQNAIFEATFKS